ncbi:MAG TPA: histidine ammonia-lyase [Candidatus Thermoplasmatota archaeon]|nr:histidine ammonia-lyase [Candidatus Thermoplasmatota archaeon]
MAVAVDGRTLTLEDVVRVARGGEEARLDPAARKAVLGSRRAVEAMLAEARPRYGVTHRDKVGRVRVAVDALEEGGRVAYGVTTGFGELARVQVRPDQVRELQLNLLLSHACGLGEPFPRDVVRAAMLLRANALAHGLSGVREDVIELLLAMLARDVVPVVPSRGSLGASGDLAPLAHLALVLVGRGEAYFQGQRVNGAVAVERAGLTPLTLEAKEGLALVNGTQFMAAILALAVHDGLNLVRAAEVAGGMSLEALLGSVAPLDARVHAARPHAGQARSADNLRRLTAASGIVASHAGCDRVQDAYSLRCMPQVLGAARTAISHARDVLETEFNSATDNPLVLGDDVVSGGNFHGEPLALIGAYLAVALHEVAAMSERRVARLVDPRLSEGLPAFLTQNGGLHSGLMLPQYVAAALVLESRALTNPPAADSLPTSANQEDHNSNGLVQALHAEKILRNGEHAIAIELLCAAQALDLRRPLQPGVGSAAAHRAVRAVVTTLEGDRELHGDVRALAELVRTGRLVAEVEKDVGVLA